MAHGNDSKIIAQGAAAQSSGSPLSSCVTRRKFLFGSGAIAASTVMIPGVPGMGGKALAAEVARYPRQLIGSLSKLKTDEPQTFNYPDKGRNSRSILIKLGEVAGGGIGTDMDVVAYNTLCTHMGGDTSRVYVPEESILGPSPFHQSTFDLTRHGIIIAGHATESLPQVLLELDGDDIYATGLIGLIYGRYDNLKS